MFIAGMLGPRGIWSTWPVSFRFQRIFGHGDRAGADDGVHVREEFRFALSVGVDHGILAAVASVAVDLAAGLPVRAAGREPARTGADVREHRHRDAAGRIVA